VIAILEITDPDFVNEAAKRGIFAYVIDHDPKEPAAARPARANDRARTATRGRAGTPQLTDPRRRDE
jgi:hypothetical protein